MIKTNCRHTDPADSRKIEVSGNLPSDALKLGDVPNMFSLIPLAQSVNSPIARLQASDGLAGGQYQQQENYAKTIRAVTDTLARNLGFA